MKTANKTLESPSQSIHGVVVGMLAGISDSGQPFVIYPSNPQDVAMPAKTTVLLDEEDIGKEVALLFENGNPQKPMIIGRMQTSLKEKPKDNESREKIRSEKISVQIDDDTITLNAKKSITLKCGKASITLTSAGKILLRGGYVLSRSSGVNRIKGGSVQIN